MCSVMTGGMAWVSSSLFIQSIPMASAASFQPAVCPIPGAEPLAEWLSPPFSLASRVSGCPYVSVRTSR